MLKLFTNSFGQEITCPVLRFERGDDKINRKKIILTCLNHGDEIIGTMAALQILELVKKDLNWKGELIILPCMNQGGLERSSRFFEMDNLYDTSTQNMNRLWGAGHNSLTGKVCDTIFEFLLSEKPDLVIDCHSYAINSLIHIILDRGHQEQKLISLAQNSKIPFYLEYEAQTVAEQKLDHCLTNQLLLNGILAITIELGPQIGFDQHQLDLATKSLSNLVLGTSFDLFEMQNATDLKNKITHRQELKNESNFCGLFVPMCDLGKWLSKNTVVAIICNLVGEEICKIKMPCDGAILVFAKSNYVYPKATICVIVKE